MTTKVVNDFITGTNTIDPMDEMERDYNSLLNSASEYNMAAQDVKVDLRDKIKSIVCVFLVLFIFVISGTIEYNHSHGGTLNDSDTIAHSKKLK